MLEELSMDEEAGRVVNQSPPACSSPPWLHLANEQHRYATLTATPLRAKTQEQDRSERMRREGGADFPKGTGMMHGCKLPEGHYQNMLEIQ